MSRLPVLDPKDMSPEQKAAYDAIKSGPRGVVRGPLAAWLHRPVLADRAQSLGAYCRYGTSLGPELSELAIVITGVYWQADYETEIHKQEALKAGVRPELIEAIERREEPATFANEREEAVYRFSRALIETREMPDDLYEESARILGPDGLVDLVGVLGYYALVSMTIRAFAIPPLSRR